MSPGSWDLAPHLPLCSVGSLLLPLLLPLPCLCSLSLKYVSKIFFKKEMQLISVHWFYILPLGWILVSVLEILGWTPLGFPHRMSCHLQRARVWLLCWFGWLLVLFVVWLLRLGVLVLCWTTVARVDIPVVLVTLGRKLCFPPIEDNIPCGLFVDGFYDIEVFFLFLYTLKSFNQERTLYWSNVFSASIKRLYGFVLSFIYAVHHIDWFVELNHPCSPGINPTWLWWITLLMYCWILLVSILGRIFAFMFIRDMGRQLSF